MISLEVPRFVTMHAVESSLLLRHCVRIMRMVLEMQVAGGMDMLCVMMLRLRLTRNLVV